MNLKSKCIFFPQLASPLWKKGCSEECRPQVLLDRNVSPIVFLSPDPRLCSRHCPQTEAGQVLAILQRTGHRLQAPGGGEPRSLAQVSHQRGEEAGQLPRPPHGGGGDDHHPSPVPATLHRPCKGQRCIIQQQNPQWQHPGGWGVWVVELRSSPIVFISNENVLLFLSP